MMKAWVLAFALLAERAIAREVLGAIHLDAYTFDKVVAYHDVFVKFDKYIPYGPKEDAFRELAKQVGELSTDLLIGWIGVQDYGACGRAHGACGRGAEARRDSIDGHTGPRR